MIAPLNQGQFRPLGSPFPASQRPVIGLSASGWDSVYPAPRKAPQGRKSIISTGLCESRGFSTTIYHTPTGPFFDYLPYPPPRFFDYLPYPYK